MHLSVGMGETPKPASYLYTPKGWFVENWVLIPCCSEVWALLSKRGFLSELAPF
jgi:hypothetical protein